MEQITAFMNSIRPYFTDESSESFRQLIVRAADQYVAQNLDIYSISVVTKSLHEEWTADLQVQGVDIRHY